LRGRRHRGRRSNHSGGGSGFRPGYPLTMACSDEYVRVVRITTEHAAESRLVSMGINPGALLHVISASARGPIVVARGETRFGIDRKTAWHVRVVPAAHEGSRTHLPVFCDDNCRGCSYRGEMMRAEYGESTTLDMIRPGESGRVLSVRGRGETVSRLMKLGFVKDTLIRILEKDSAADLLRVKVNGGEVEISGWDALHVIVEAER
jgi:Fe2+ transport system protein FeoA